jgi:hypothetical protein
LRQAGTALLLAAGLCVSAWGQVQWGWTDANGQRQYSDRPPPADVPQKNIFKRPPGSEPPPARVYGDPTPRPPASAASAPASAASAPASAPAARPAASAPAASASGAASAAKADASKPLTPEEAFQKRRKEQAEAEAKAQKEAADKARLDERCAKARGYVKALQDGQRIARTDAQGNRALLDDAERQKELARAQQDVAENCK